MTGDGHEVTYRACVPRIPIRDFHSKHYTAAIGFFSKIDKFDNLVIYQQATSLDINYNMT